jgi:hypothetical protein
MLLEATICDLRKTGKKQYQITNRTWIILEIRKLEDAPSLREIQKFFSESRITLS